MEAQRRVPEVPPLPLPNLQLTLGQEIRQEIRGTETPMGEGGQNVSEISNCIFVADKFLQKGTHT